MLLYAFPNFPHTSRLSWEVVLTEDLSTTSRQKVARTFPARFALLERRACSASFTANLMSLVRRIAGSFLFITARGSTRGGAPLCQVGKGKVRPAASSTKIVRLFPTCTPYEWVEPGRYPQSTGVFPGWGGAFPEIYLEDEVKKIDFPIFIFLLYLWLDNDPRFLVSLCNRFPKSSLFLWLEDD